MNNLLEIKENLCFIKDNDNIIFRTYLYKRNINILILTFILRRRQLNKIKKI